MEQAFLGFKVEVVKLRYPEDVADCMSVIVKVGSSSNANVVHVNADCCPKRFMFKNNVAIDEIHHGLEHRWRGGESEVHHCRFKKVRIWF